MTSLGNPSKNFYSLQCLLYMVKCLTGGCLLRTSKQCGTVVRVLVLVHHQRNWTGHLSKDTCAFPAASNLLGDISVSYVVLFRLDYNDDPYSLCKRKSSSRHILTLHPHFHNWIIRYSLTGHAKISGRNRSYAY